ncbi:hypothetical protein WICPIJ_007104 [Wickerhamomyces pijperi]|uniref:Uncharacterized protein n=1 Tax=Wickerhamomyces pijperi TaxID=599730 RepID=A0A9P8Q2J7_WICPI|nr:hypothetical protein WICPIJ_007104 [Wickerhamomyces pijperi]
MCNGTFWFGSREYSLRLRLFLDETSLLYWLRNCKRLSCVVGGIEQCNVGEVQRVEDLVGDLVVVVQMQDELQLVLGDDIIGRHRIVDGKVLEQMVNLIVQQIVLDESQDGIQVDELVLFEIEVQKSDVRPVQVQIVDLEELVVVILLQIGQSLLEVCEVQVQVIKTERLGVVVDGLDIFQARVKLLEELIQEDVLVVSIAEKVVEMEPIVDREEPLVVLVYNEEQQAKDVVVDLVSNRSCVLSSLYLAKLLNISVCCFLDWLFELGNSMARFQTCGIYDGRKFKIHGQAIEMMNGGSKKKSRYNKDLKLYKC